MKKIIKGKMALASRHVKYVYIHPCIQPSSYFPQFKPR